MKDQPDSIFEIDMEPELIQIDCYGILPGIFHHLLILSNPVERTGNFFKV